MAVGRGGVRIPIITEFDGAGIDRFAGKMGKLGKSLTRNVTLPIVALGAATVKAFADFEDKLTQSFAIMGELSQEMKDDMSNAARDVAKNLGISHADAAESFFFLASAGLDATQSIAALPQVAAFAKAGMFDMATATDLATDAQSALGLSVDDAQQNLVNLTRITDVFSKANALANTSVEQVATAITTKAGVALRNVNKDLEEGVAVLAVFADSGVKGEEAGTLLARTLEGLTTRARMASEDFKELNISVFDVDGAMRPMADIVQDLENSLSSMTVEQRDAAIAQLGFTKLAKQGVLQLLGNSEALREYESELRSAGGATQEMADKQLESFTQQLAILKAEFTDLAMDIGPIIIDDFLKPLMEVFKGLQERLAGLSDEQRQNLVHFLGLIAVIGPVLLISAKLIIAIKAIAGALMFLTATPLGLTIVAIGSLILIGIALVKNFDAIRAKFIEIFEGIKLSVTTKLSELRDKFSEIISSLPAPVKLVANLVIMHFNAILAGIEAVVNGIVAAFNRIPSFTVPSFVPGLGGKGFNPPKLNKIKTPRVPKLAEGGIVNRATLAMIGESGPEAVIPLSGPNSGAMGNTFNIVVNAGLGTDGANVGRQIVEAIKRFERTSGPVFAGA